LSVCFSSAETFLSFFSRSLATEPSFRAEAVSTWHSKASGRAVWQFTKPSTATRPRRYRPARLNSTSNHRPYHGAPFITAGKTATPSSAGNTRQQVRTATPVPRPHSRRPGARPFLLRLLLEGRLPRPHYHSNITVTSPYISSLNSLLP